MRLQGEGDRNIQFRKTGLYEMAANRREDPGYTQVSGYVPNELARQFKAACALRNVTAAEAMEQMIALWLAQEVDKSME